MRDSVGNKLAVGDYVAFDEAIGDGRLPIKTVGKIITFNTIKGATLCVIGHRQRGRWSTDITKIAPEDAAIHLLKGNAFC